MEIVVGGRLVGKTHYLVQRAIEHGPEDSVIVVSGVQEAQWVKERVADELAQRGYSPVAIQRLVQRMVMPAGHYSMYRGQMVDHKVFVDNAEWVLEHFLGRMPDTITAHALIRTPQRAVDITETNPGLKEPST